MPFLSSLLSCCSSSQSNKEKSHSHTEVRRARIVRCYDRSYNGSMSSFHRYNNESICDALPPPRYSEIPHDDSRLAQYILENEKPQLMNEEVMTPPLPPTPPPAVFYPPLQPHRTLIPTHTASSQSSIISIPSTRLSGLTSTYTGATNRTRIIPDDVGENDGGSGRWRNSMTDRSLEEGTPPPSYYAGSEGGREERVESTREEGEEEVTLHPVLTDGWLERLTCDAVRRLREEERERNNQHG